MSPPLILASTSRYRRELLERLRWPFTCMAPAVDETPSPGETPAALSERLAQAKAMEVAHRHPQAVVIGLLVSWGRPGFATAIGVLALIQAGLMWWFVQKPVERALYLSAFGVPFYVSGMMVSAFAVRTLPMVTNALTEVAR